jgi:hypothetical protein
MLQGIARIRSDVMRLSKGMANFRLLKAGPS